MVRANLTIAHKVCFLVLHISVNLSLLAFKMNFDLHAYSRESMFTFLTADLQKCAMSFMLFWTLFYGESACVSVCVCV